MWIAVLAGLFAAAPIAHAKGWPTPAAGQSVSGDPEIIFTFDDGPSPSTTIKVLDILAAHHIHAVFFLVGEMAGSENKKVPKIIERILHDGHVIGTHTMTHKDLCKLKDEAKANREIDDGKATVERVAGLRTVWFRAPYGVRCKRLDDMLAARGLGHFHWDLDPQEWKHNDPRRAVKYVTSELAKMSGRNVLLMHDIKTATVKALPEILDWLEAENGKRAIAHKRQIRIVQSYDLAAERVAPGLLAWLGDASTGPRGWPKALARVLP